MQIIVVIFDVTRYSYLTVLTPSFGRHGLANATCVTLIAYHYLYKTAIYLFKEPS